MGSVDTSQKDLAVLVTGFGPFKEKYPVNPSWEIAALLPDYLPADRAKDAAHRSARHLPPVRIVKLPGAVRVSYEYTRDLVPRLWDNDETEHKIDYAIHVGMAGPQLVYQIERRGHRDGYYMPDVDGRLLEDETRHDEEGDKWIWHGAPHELCTDFDIDDVHRRWIQRSPKNLDLRISEDAGRYLCDFIYYSSLAHLWKQGKPRKIVFLHVPLHSDTESLQRGVELVLTLIRSIAESEWEKKKSVV
ncbi:putative pyroglutamyl peptidase type I [Astrocystis sublimbata]|nr:putative pyroglutamyl peptidase type I [Astrocystis sublimbata]